MYSSNDIKKAQNEHLNIVSQNLNVRSCELNANSLTFLGLFLHIGSELNERANFEKTDFIPPYIYTKKINVHCSLLTYMNKSKSVLFYMTYWLSDWRHPVWMLRVCSTLQYKIRTSTVFPSHRHTSVRWKSQPSVPYLLTSHRTALQILLVSY